MVLLFSSSPSSSSLSSCYVCLYLRSFCSDLPLSLLFFSVPCLRLCFSLTHSLNIFDIRLFTTFQTALFHFQGISTIVMVKQDLALHETRLNETSPNSTTRQKLKSHFQKWWWAYLLIFILLVLIIILPMYVFFLLLCNISQQQTINHFPSPKPN